jgi:hypothetical protein
LGVNKAYKKKKETIKKTEGKIKIRKEINKERTKVKMQEKERNGNLVRLKNMKVDKSK